MLSQKSKLLRLATLFVSGCLLFAITSFFPVSPLYAAIDGPCAWAESVGNVSTQCNVGIGIPEPGQRLHVADGNILLQGGGETALQIKRDVTFTRTITTTGEITVTGKFPIFDVGRIIQAGDGDPELRILYRDDNNPEEHAVMELDRKGIIASVKQTRGSHFEGFISGKDPEPIFRLNSWPKMRLEMGDGGTTPVDVAIQREATNTLTLMTGSAERLRVDPTDVKVSSGYLKLATSSGIPPLTDCDTDDEVGRMKVDGKQAILYICTAEGWKNFTPPTMVNLPLIQK